MVISYWIPRGNISFFHFPHNWPWPVSASGLSMADRLPPIPLPAPNEQPPSPKKSPFSKDPRAQSALHSRATSSGSIFALSESALRRQQSLPQSSSSLDTSRRESVAWSDVTLPLARSRPLEEIGRQLAKIDLESKTRVERVNELQRQLDRKAGFNCYSSHSLLS